MLHSFSDGNRGLLIALACFVASVVFCPRPIAANESPLQCLSSQGRSVAREQVARVITGADILDFIVSSSGGDADNAPSLTLQLTLSSAFSNTPYVSLLYWAVGHDQTWINVPKISGDANSTEIVFALTQQLNRYARDGTYAVRAINIIDNFGSSLRLNEGELNDLGWVTQVAVSNELADVTPPQLDSLSLSDPTFVDTRPTANYDLQASDDVSGLQQGVVMEFTSPTGKSLQKWVYLNESNQASGSFEFPNFAANGVYRVNTIRLYDNAGNSNFSQDYLGANPESSTVTIFHPEADNNLPALESFKLNAVFDPCVDRPFITVRGLASDDKSGVDGVYLRLSRPAGGRLDRWLSNRSGELLHSFGSDVALTTEFTPGSYQVSYIRLDDLAGNQLSYQGASLTGAIDSEVRVWFPQLNQARVEEEAAFRISATVSGSDQSDYLFGSNASDDQVSAGGGDDFIFPSEGVDVIHAGLGDDTIYLQEELLDGAEVDTRVFGDGGKDAFIFGGTLNLGRIVIEAIESVDSIVLSDRIGKSDLSDARRSPLEDGLVRLNLTSGSVDLQVAAPSGWNTLATFPGQTSPDLVRGILHTDADGIPDVVDDFPSDPSASVDSDGDGYPDNWNAGYGASDSVWGLQLDALPNDSDDWLDSDADGLGDNLEAQLGTDPTAEDSDGDGWTDLEEYQEGADPLSADSEPDLQNGLPIWMLYEAMK